MTLPEVRVIIDEVDAQIKPLFLKRMECATCVAEAKAKTGADVFAPKRECEIIEGATADVDASVREEYAAFLRHLMSVSRRYQYGKLTDMQDKVIAAALDAAALDGEIPHTRIEIRFSCDRTNSNLNLFINMVNLNGIIIDRMTLETRDDRQWIDMVLEGNIKAANIRQLLCQLGKEAKDFAIQALR